jgi:hypothetical protein
MLSRTDGQSNVDQQITLSLRDPPTTFIVEYTCFESCVCLIESSA